MLRGGRDAAPRWRRVRHISHLTSVGRSRRLRVDGRGRPSLHWTALLCAGH